MRQLQHNIMMFGVHFSIKLQSNDMSNGIQIEKFNTSLQQCCDIFEKIEKKCRCSAVCWLASVDWNINNCTTYYCRAEAVEKIQEALCYYQRK